MEEEDFSVRNEVESLKAPQSDDYVYDHEPSPYDDIVEGINKAPPFPSVPNPPPHPDPWINHQHQMYDSIMRQQLSLIHQQQIANEKLMKMLTARKDTINWKYIALGLGLFVIFILTRSRPSRPAIRPNPQRERLLDYLDELSDY